MKVFKKRVIALYLDCFIYGSIIACIQLAKPDLLQNDILQILIFVPIFFKELVFRNASIAKKLFGLSIYNTRWEKPKVLTLIRHTALMWFVGYLLLFKIVFIRGDLFELFEWEKNVVGTFVIDKKVYAKLKADAENMDGKFADNMTELYMMYLRDFYAKR